MTAFEKGLEALLPRLRRFAHGLTANHADADDLAQITVERALRARMQWQEGTRKTQEASLPLRGRAIQRELEDP